VIFLNCFLSLTSCQQSKALRSQRIFYETKRAKKKTPRPNIN